MNYKRTLPRDLFNESKLLKCIGKIAVLVEDEMINGLHMDFSECASGFDIRQLEDSGDIFINNIVFFDDANNEVLFSTPANSKDNWPLLMHYKGQEYYPLNEDGEYQLCKNLFTETPAISYSVSEVTNNLKMLGFEVIGSRELDNYHDGNVIVMIGGREINVQVGHGYLRIAELVSLTVVLGPRTQLFQDIVDQLQQIQDHNLTVEEL